MRNSGARGAIVRKTATLSVEPGQATCGYISTQYSQASTPTRHFRALATHLVMLLASFPGIRDSTSALVLRPITVGHGNKVRVSCAVHVY